MKEISLGGGKFGAGKVALIDDEDFERVSAHRWRASPGKNTTYAYRKWRVGGGRRRYQSLHHFVLGIKPGKIKKKIFVDHKNRNGLDCQKENLRYATSTQNQANGSPRKGKSRFRGVAWHKAHSKWRAYIQVNRKWKHLGYFADETEAAKAYDVAAIREFGEFASCNFPGVSDGKAETTIRPG